jgi:small subunit ribosomal protein S6
LRNYELVLIISPEVAEEDIPGTLDKVNEYIVSKGGSITETNSWGKRKLAYPIKHFRDGNYFLSLLELEPDTITDIESNLRISETILRHMLVRLDD